MKSGCAKATYLVGLESKNYMGSCWERLEREHVLNRGSASVLVDL